MAVKKYEPTAITKTLLKPFLLYSFSIPFILSVIVALFMANIESFFLNVIALLLYLGVLYLSKKGFTQEYIYNQSIFAKAPKVPYKMLSAALLGLVVFYAAFVISDKTVLNSGFLALVAFVGYYLYYGFDPKEDKVVANLGDISEEFFFETINEAREKLDFIEQKLTLVKKESLHKKVENSLLISEEILETIQKDPKDIRVARKFLMVYLDGVKDVLNSYTELESDDISDETHTKLEGLFDDVQERFDRELDRLKNNNQFDLDVNIDTLKQQINN
jgi:5-bromo-4-chloroindolyl phosphate hydrolysis protein